MPLAPVRGLSRTVALVFGCGAIIGEALDVHVATLKWKWSV